MGMGMGIGMGANISGSSRVSELAHIRGSSNIVLLSLSWILCLYLSSSCSLLSCLFEFRFTPHVACVAHLHVITVHCCKNTGDPE